MIKVENVPELYGNHLEGRVAFHAKHTNEANLEEILLFVPIIRILLQILKSSIAIFAMIVV